MTYHSERIAWRHYKKLSGKFSEKWLFKNYNSFSRRKKIVENNENQKLRRAKPENKV